MAKKKSAKKKAAKKSKSKRLDACLTYARKLLDEQHGSFNNEQAEAASAMRRICDGLAAATGIKRITYEYNGEGDSGAMSDVWFEPKPSVEIPETLKDQLENCAWAFIPSGFENNDGGFGRLEIDIAKHTIVLEHSERIVEVNETEKEYEF